MWNQTVKSLQRKLVVEWNRSMSDIGWWNRSTNQIHRWNRSIGRCKQLKKKKKCSTFIFVQYVIVARQIDRWNHFASEIVVATKIGWWMNSIDYVILLVSMNRWNSWVKSIDERNVVTRKKMFLVRIVRGIIKTTCLP